MTESVTGEVQQLIQGGRAAATAGDSFIARERFRRATELDPTSVEAWLGLSSVVPILAEKRDYLQRALELDPGSAEAQRSLHYVEQLLAQGLQLAPSRPRAERAALAAVPVQTNAPASASVIEHCYRHPERETGLRCIQCNRPICGACAQTTPVGQLCPECRKGRRPRNYQVSIGNIIVGLLVGLFGGLIASFLVALVLSRIPFFGFILTLFAGPSVAELIIRVSDRLTGLKRGPSMQVAICSGLVLGSLPLLLLTILNPSLLTLLLGLFTVLAVTTTVARLK